MYSIALQVFFFHNFIFTVCFRGVVTAIWGLLSKPLLNWSGFFMRWKIKSVKY